MKEDLSLIRTVEDYIIENKLKEALLVLKSIFEKYNQEDLIDESLLVHSRLRNLEKGTNNGIVDYFDNELNKIRLSVINLRRSAKTLTENQRNIVEEVSTKQLPSIIFDERFEDNANEWWTGEDETVICSIKNRRYFIENITTSRKQQTTGFQNIKIDTDKNFSIKCRITFIDGPLIGAYGINWGKGEGINHFQFLITADGSFVVSYYINGEWFPQSGWMKNNAIKKGKDTNSLEIIKNGSIVNYKVNNEVVFTTEFLSFFGDDIDFSCSSGMKIAIDFLQIIN